MDYNHNSPYFWGEASKTKLKEKLKMTEETKPVNPIDAALALSKQRAAETTTAIANAPAVNNTGMIEAPPPPQKLTMDNMGAGALSVDAWLKVDKNGLMIGDSGLIAEIEAILDLKQIVLTETIKCGNPVTYRHTTDRSTCTTGGTWPQAIAEIRAMDPSARPYSSVQLPFELVGDVVDFKKATVGKAGDIVGIATSTTNWNNWKLFYDDLKARGLNESVVRVKLTAQSKSNKQYTWGLLAFELIGEETQPE